MNMYQITVRSDSTQVMADRTQLYLLRSNENSIPRRCHLQINLQVVIHRQTGWGMDSKIQRYTTFDVILTVHRR